MKSYGQKDTTFSVSVGLNFQTTVMNFFNTKFITGYGFPRYYIPHNYERNIQGLGIPIVFKSYFNHHRNFFEYVPNFRYDEIYFHPDSTVKFHVKPVKAIIINQSFGIGQFFLKKKLYLKSGFTWFNPFKHIPTQTIPAFDYVASINYISFDIGTGFIFSKNKKQELNFNTQYISRGQMQTLYTKNGYVTYSLRYVYRVL